MGRYVYMSQWSISTARTIINMIVVLAVKIITTIKLYVVGNIWPIKAYGLY